MSKTIITSALILAAALSGAAWADSGATLGSVARQNLTNQVPSISSSTLGAGADTGANPASGTTQGSGSVTATVTLRCADGVFKDGLAQYPNGVKAECGANTTSTPTQYAFRFCESAANGGTCSQASDWTQAYIAPGASNTFDANLTVTVNSCASDASSCEVTVKSSSSFSGDGDSLKSQGEKAMSQQNADDGSVTSSVTGTGVYQNGTPVVPGKNSNSGAYNGGLVANGGWLTSCFDTQRTQLDGGQDVFTCDNSQSVNFGAQGCSQTQTCTAWSDSTTTWTKTCQQTVNSSQITCEKKTPTYSCELSNQVSNYDCSVANTPNVRAVTVSNCSPGQTILTIGDQSSINKSNNLYWMDIVRNGTHFGPPVASITCDGGGNLVINGVQFNSYESSGTYPSATSYPTTTVYLDSNGNGSGSGEAVGYNIYDDHNCGAGMCPSNMLRTYVDVSCTNGNCSFSVRSGYGPGFLCNAAGVSVQQYSNSANRFMNYTYYGAPGCNSGGTAASMTYQVMKRTLVADPPTVDDGCLTYENSP